MVAVSALISIVFLGKLKSVREGTVIFALLIGKVIGIVFTRCKPKIAEWIEK
jgi:uncharacterized membrane protein YczE